MVYWQRYVTSALLVAGTLTMTVGADVAPEQYRLALIVGGAVLAFGTAAVLDWQGYFDEFFDERTEAIYLRSSMATFFAFMAVTTPLMLAVGDVVVVETVHVLMGLVALVLVTFSGSTVWYGRRM